MSHQDPRQSGSAGAAFAIIAILALLLMAGLAVVGGGMLFYVRSRVVRSEQVALREAMVAQAQAEQARRMEEMAREQAENQRRMGLEAQREAERAIAALRQTSGSSTGPGEADAGAGERILFVDREGQASEEGRVLGPDDLDQWINQAATGGESPVRLRLKVDGRCPTERIIGLMERMLEAGITEIQLQKSDGTVDAELPADARPESTSEPEG